MNFILLGPGAEKNSGRDSSGRALGELWEIYGKPFPPEMFLQRVWNSTGRALGELWESSGKPFTPEVFLQKARESSGRALPDLSQSYPKVLSELSLILWRTSLGRR